MMGVGNHLERCSCVIVNSILAILHIGVSSSSLQRSTPSIIRLQGTFSETIQYSQYLISKHRRGFQSIALLLEGFMMNTMEREQTRSE